VRIRSATDADRAGILGVHESAFGKEQGPGIVDLVSGLLGDRTAMPLFSLVAEIDGRVVGHALFTAVRLQSDRQSVSGQILAPLAASKGHQGEGVGGSLVDEGLKHLAASGVELVFVLGHPDYYRKFWFRPARVLGYEAPYPIPIEHEDAWMDPRHPLPAGVRVQVSSAHNTIIAIGPLVLLAALLSVPIYYLIYRYAPEPKKDVSLMRYVFISLSVAALAYVIGAGVGIAAGCSSASGGNLCGLVGVLGVGPLLAAAAVFLYAHFWARNARRAP
jgi:predicted N-acetyltransferase YhbS